MSKTRPFSIYLLKPHYDASNSLKNEHSLGETPAEMLPSGARLFVLDSPATDPWWKSYFKVDMVLKQASKGALVFLPVADRCFALSFGHVYHNLKDESFEYDFGLRVTLNCIDPKELKSTDTLEPGAARRQRTQLPTGSDLTYFDFDRDSAILKSLTGKVLAEHKNLFKYVTGSNSLLIRSEIQAEGLVALCEELLALYESQDYRTNFPDIENIVPVRDPVVIDRLNEKLIEGLKERSDSLYLTIPDMIDYRNQGYLASFSGAGTSLVYEDVYLEKYYEYLEMRSRPLENIDYDQLRTHGLKLTDEEGNVRESYSLINCLIFDTVLESGTQTYHLAEGNWYKVENSYIAKLQAALDPLCVDIALPNYAHANEEDYNAAVAAGDGTFLCLDRSDISADGQTQVEPCDLYSTDGPAAVFHHIKRSTVSAQLSHLFNQGTNAVELIKLEEECLAKLRAIITEKSIGAARAQFLQALGEKQFRVVFGIVTHKDRTKKSENLPLFSRVSLMRISRVLKFANTECHFGYIEDLSAPKAGVRKPRRRKVPTPAEAVVAV
jgi:uncharacterized protein (TIGR04141 family)